MDEGVRDSEPSEQNPEPQFISGSGDWKVVHRSLNGPENIGCFWKKKTLFNCILGDTDERPNIWSKPTGNWAKLYLTDFKIHHMVDRNWARNADVHCSGWQISDCSRGYVIKSAIPVWAAQKSFTDGVFQLPMKT